MLIKTRTHETLSLCLRVLNVPKASYYRMLHTTEHNNYEKKHRGLRRKIERIIRRHSGYGYRRIQQELWRKYKIKINHKPLKKLLKIWNLKKFRKVKIPKPSPLKEYIKKLGAKINLVNQIPNPKPFQIIFTDFTEIICSFGKIEFIPYVDLITKRIIGWNMDQNDNTENALTAYKRARRYLKKMKVNLRNTIIHQDQDSVFTSYEYAGTLLNDGIRLSFTERGFKDNPHMESFFSHFKDEYGDIIGEARNLREARGIIKKCVLDCNKHRIHSALNGRSPDEFIHAVYQFSKG